tara:strand:+ start:4418 stop:4648 length:231 start_codon:yes stop_codon:yes gene_type:complete
LAPAPGQVTPPCALPQTSISGTSAGKVVAGDVACLETLTAMVVGVADLQEDEEPEKAVRQVAALQWSTVVPHFGGC